MTMPKLISLFFEDKRRENEMLSGIHDSASAECYKRSRQINTSIMSFESIFSNPFEATRKKFALNLIQIETSLTLFCIQMI